MPIDPITLAAISGGVQSGGSALDGYFNRRATRRQNEMSRRHSDNRYNQMRKDALSDFNLTNAYNSPAQQMQRLKEAGLNPHLIYGKGAVQTAQSPKQSTAAAPQFNVPTSNIGASIASGLQSGINTFQMAQQKRLNDATIATQQANQTKALAETGKLMMDTKFGKFTLGLQNELRDTTIQAAKLTNLQLQALTSKTTQETSNLKTTQTIGLKELELKKIATSNDVKKTALMILNSKIDRQFKSAQTQKVQQETKNLLETKKILTQTAIIKKWEAELTRRGLNPKDQVAWRLLEKMVSSAKNLPKSKYDNNKSWKANKGALKGRGE